MGKIKSTKDLLMLLLYSKGYTGRQCEPIRGRTRLMKMVFLFDKEIKQRFNLDKIFTRETIPDFTAHEFGPFSPQVFADLEFLVDLGFVKVEAVNGDKIALEEALEYGYWHAGSASEIDDLGPEYEQDFSLHKMGEDFVKDELLAELTPNQQSVLNEFKLRCTSASLRALLKYIYSKYPEMATKSRIREEIMSES